MSPRAKAQARLILPLSDDVLGKRSPFPSGSPLHLWRGDRGEVGEGERGLGLISDEPTG